ncbi:MAG: molybdopterin-dependent oxidoreductase [Actinomycetota bacterium]
MAGRRINLALRVLLPGAAVTGGLTFLVGSGPVRPVVVLHGVVGLALLVLTPWKTAVVRRGLPRRRRDRWLSLALTGAVLLALLSGLAHGTGLLVAAGQLSAMQVHVGAGLVALAAGLAHARRRRQRARAGDLSRRTVVRAGLVVAAAGGGYAALSAAGTALGWPGARRRATGSYELAAASMPATSWLLDAVPDDDPLAWRLTVTSAGVARSYSVADLAVPGDRVRAVLDCTGGWWATQEWSGTQVRRLLPEGATGSVEVVSATGYRRRLPLTDGLLLAVAAGGAPLTSGRGAPVRLVVPGRRGFHWVKWVTRIEHDERPWWLEPPLPLR